MDSTQIKEHFCHRRKFFLTALQDAAQAYRGPGTGRGNKAPSPHSALPPLRTPMLLGCPPLALPGGGGPRRPLAARSSPRNYLLMDTRHLPASSSPRSWRTRCGCLKCSSREHLNGHRDRTTRSSLRACGPAFERSSHMARPRSTISARLPAPLPRLGFSICRVGSAPPPPSLSCCIWSTLGLSFPICWAGKSWLCHIGANGWPLDLGLRICPTNRQRLSSRRGHCWAGDASGATQWKQGKLSAPFLVELRADLAAPSLSL